MPETRGSIPGSGRSPREGHATLQYSCLQYSLILFWENPMDRGSGWATVHRVTKSQTQLKRLTMHASNRKPDENTVRVAETLYRRIVLVSIWSEAFLNDLKPSSFSLTFVLLLNSNMCSQSFPLSWRVSFQFELTVSFIYLLLIIAS